MDHRIGPAVTQEGPNRAGVFNGTWPHEDTDRKRLVRRLAVIHEDVVSVLDQLTHSRLPVSHGQPCPRSPFGRAGSHRGPLFAEFCLDLGAFGFGRADVGQGTEAVATQGMLDQ